MAAPALSAAAMVTTSAISGSLAPACLALPEWISMQYGHCVVNATASAISSLYLAGIAPSAMAALSKAQKACIATGALASRVFSFPKLLMLYKAHLLISKIIMIVRDDGQAAGSSCHRKIEYLTQRRQNVRKCPGVERFFPGTSTRLGAQVGDLFMSLIHTCQLCGVNSFDYLIELQRHAQELATQPGGSTPWNHRETLARAGVS